jgi:hypothetical protein
MSYEQPVWIGSGVLAIGAIVLAYALSDKGNEISPNVKTVKSFVTDYAQQERDLNGNGVLEKFYEIEGRKDFVEIDGKRLEDSLQ